MEKNTKFPVNTHRFDPYKNFRFRVKWDGRYVAGMSKVSALKRTSEPVKYREGGDPSYQRVSPGSWSFDAITLERGITHDPDFEKWANLVYDVKADMISLKSFRKDLIIEILNENGDIAHVYYVYRCWVSEYQAVPALNADENEVAIETIKLENEGWERDTKVTEPPEV